MTYRLTDKFGRDLGSIPAIWNKDGAFVGQFTPGSDYSKIEILFDEYQELVGGGKGDHQDMYNRLVDLEPQLVSIRDGSVENFHVAIVAKVQERYTISLAK